MIFVCKFSSDEIPRGNEFEKTHTQTHSTQTKSWEMRTHTHAETQKPSNSQSNKWRMHAKSSPTARPPSPNSWKRLIHIQAPGQNLGEALEKAAAPQAKIDSFRLEGHRTENLQFERFAFSRIAFSRNSSCIASLHARSCFPLNILPPVIHRITKQN